MFNWVRKLFTKRTKQKAAIKIAQEKGYLDDEQALQATLALDNATDDDLENTSTDLLIEKGFLDEDQAEVIELEVRQRAPRESLDEHFRQAQNAAEAHKTGATRLDEVLAAKKKAKGS